MGARIYDRSLGNYTQSDPITNDIGEPAYGLYTYSQGLVGHKNDPTGLYPGENLFNSAKNSAIDFTNSIPLVGTSYEEIRDDGGLTSFAYGAVDEIFCGGFSC